MANAKLITKYLKLETTLNGTFMEAPLNLQHLKYLPAQFKHGTGAKTDLKQCQQCALVKLFSVTQK